MLSKQSLLEAGGEVKSGAPERTRDGSAAALTYSLRMHEQTRLSADSDNMKRSHGDRNGSMLRNMFGDVECVWLNMKLGDCVSVDR